MASILLCFVDVIFRYNLVYVYSLQVYTCLIFISLSKSFVWFGLYLVGGKLIGLLLTLMQVSLSWFLGLILNMVVGGVTLIFGLSMLVFTS